MKNNVVSTVAFLLSLLVPIHTIAFAVGFLVLVDVVTGVWASLKTKQRITSDRFGRSVTKTIVYLLALVVAQVAQAYVFGDDVPVLKVVSGLIGTTELLSIGENLTRISGIDFKRVLQERLLPSRPPKAERGITPDEGEP